MKLQTLAALVVVAGSLAAASPALSGPTGIVRAPEAVGCATTGDFSTVAWSAVKGDMEAARRALESRFLDGSCVAIGGWHYEVLGRVGQYGRYTYIIAGPDKDGAWDGYYTLNEWVANWD